MRQDAVATFRAAYARFPILGMRTAARITRLHLTVVTSITVDSVPIIASFTCSNKPISTKPDALIFENNTVRYNWIAHPARFNHTIGIAAIEV
jgi:hypothetical protein